MRRRVEKLGQVGINNSGQKMTIVEYFNAHNITVKFEDGTIVTNKTFQNFKNGEVMNYNTPCYYGLGFLGGKVLKENSKILQTWLGMFLRCYDIETLKNSPSYIGCSVHPDWYNFQNFASWYEENYVEDFHLDKDILVPGNKIYGPDTCCFVPGEINQQFRIDKIRKNGLPRGVSVNGKKYSATIHIEGENTYLGSFSSILIASEVYENKRIEKLSCLAEKYKEGLTKNVYKLLKNYHNEPT